MLLIDRGHIGHVVACLTEAAAWQSDFLFIGQRNPPPHVAIDLLCHRVVPDGELELFWHGAWHGDQGNFAFPGLTDQAFV
jgi:hypothetical protein